MSRIHIFGAPGAGVTTVGRLLADQLGLHHIDIDDVVWFTTDPLPYLRKRNVQHRQQELISRVGAHEHWVITGSLCGWGDAWISQFDLVVYLFADADVRAHRIRARERARYAHERLAPGGDLHVVLEKFVDWAIAYDHPDQQNLRSANLERRWLEQLPCVVVCYDTTESSAASLCHAIIQKASTLSLG